MRALAIAAVLARAASAARADGPHRTKNRAFRLSIGVPLLGVGVAAFGLGVQHESLFFVGGAAGVLGPTAGHWYAGEFVTTGLGIRLAGAALATWGLAQDFRCSPDYCKAPDYEETLILSGFALVAVGTVWDLVTLPGAVDDYNAAHAGVAITPTALRGARGDIAPGLALVGSF